MTGDWRVARDEYVSGWLEHEQDEADWRAQRNIDLGLTGERPVSSAAVIAQLRADRVEADGLDWACRRAVEADRLAGRPAYRGQVPRLADDVIVRAAKAHLAIAGLPTGDLADFNSWRGNRACAAPDLAADPAWLSRVEGWLVHRVDGFKVPDPIHNEDAA